MNLKNHNNDYGRILGGQLDEIPKTVLAAIAVSYLLNHQNVPEERIKGCIADEWRILNENGIVPQKPGKLSRAVMPKPQPEETAV